jgi:DNA-binding response OmpR family regulator
MKQEPTILVIDDDDLLLETTAELLQDDGWQVETHHGAFGATQKILAMRPALVLLDVNMPGLSGEGLLKVLGKRPDFQDYLIVLHSSNDEARLRATAAEFGLAGYIAKGDPAALSAKVAWHLRDRRGAESA